MQISKNTINKLNNPLVVFYLVGAFFPFFSSILGVAAESIANPIMYGAISLACIFYAVRRKEYYRNIVPIVLLISMGGFYILNAVQGFIFWPLCLGLVVFASSLWSVRLISYEGAFVLGIFLFSIAIHSVPGYMTNFIEEIDPYYDYKWAEKIVDTGHVPEYDWWTYPKIGGLDRSTMPFGVSVAIAFFGQFLTLAGMTFHQAAILISVLAAGLSPIVLFYLIKETLKDRKNVMMAAMVGAIILMMSIGWSTKAHATDSENDAFGGFLLLSIFYVYMWAVNRNNYRVSLIAGGILFGWFATAWDGHKIFTMVVAMAVSILSIFGIRNGTRTIGYLRHYMGILLLGNVLWRLVLHKPDQIISLIMPTGIEIASVALIMFSVFINEFMISYSKKMNRAQISILVCAFILVGAAVWPIAWYNFYKVGFIDIGQPSVVFKTIAEQQPFATGIINYMSGLFNVFGPLSILALVCIPFMIWVGFRENHFGSILMGAWLVPFAWGFYNKSQLIFLSSIPFAFAGAWVVQYIISSKKDMDGLRVVPTILVVCGLLFYMPMLGAFSSMYQTASIFFNVASYDRMGWEPALQYFKNETAANAAVVTWWDYGHWLTAVSHKFVLIDNLQRDHMEIQDVARFFMKETNEDKAFEIISRYNDYYHSKQYIDRFGGVNVGYVAIDWTMIGKSGAMRFIATGNITTNEEGDYESYSMCQFANEYSNVNGSLMSVEGKFVKQKTLVYVCSQNKDNLAGVTINIIDDNKISVDAIDTNGGRVPWGTWMTSKGGVIFGVEDPMQIIGTCIQYSTKTSQISPTYVNFVYSTKEFKNLMMARLYFGEYIQQYKDMRLNDVEWGGLKHFTKDRSFENGFVETWKITYDGGNQSVFK